MNYTKINSFEDVILSKNKPLVICDIDNTLICPIHNMDYCYELIKKDFNDLIDDNNTDDDTGNNVNNNKLLHDLAYEMYSTCYYYVDKIQATDKDGIHKLIDRVKLLDGNLIFLTARKKTVAGLTMRTLKEVVGIDTDKYEIHYTEAAIDKGTYIERYLKDYVNKYNEMIFIDDYKTYIRDVLNKFPDTKCYRFMSIN